MKRTKQRADRCEQSIPEHVSGCRQFEGEDLLYHDRMALNAQNLKDWADQKKREMDQERDQQSREDQAYAAQTDAITRMRGMLEDENTQKRMQAYKELQDTNKRLAMEKRQREEAWKNDQHCQDKAETTLTFHHEVMDATGKITRQQ